MNWRIIAASAVGTSHGISGKPCEDSCWANVDKSAAQTAVLSIFVSDGAGSAEYGGQGAELAIQTAADFVAKRISVAEFIADDQTAIDCIIAIREVIYAEAEKRGKTARDYACTFLGVLSSFHGTLAMQIGDGAIVLDTGNGLEVPIRPMDGEYANMTRFVTDEDAVGILETKLFPSSATKVAVFSDGLQRLALNMATNTPHEPFFLPFFDALVNVSATQEDQLERALTDFLNSAAVNERTDDDKSLALAVATK